MAAGKLTTHFSPHLISSRSNRSPFSVRISGRINGFLARAGRVSLSDAPSCIFVGPIETANKETLEALYRQAREAYYNGKPLIVDDMFDRIELKLRWYGSKDVVKYPRCSLRRQSTYADAEEDPSQVIALASVWLLFLCIGGTTCLVPLIHTIGQAYQEALSSGYTYDSQVSAFDSSAILNGMLFMVLGSMIGYPVASASGEVLLDGENIKNLKLEWLRSQVGLVTQEPALLSLSIRDNIAYRRDATLDQIEEATKTTHAYKLYVY